LNSIKFLYLQVTFRSPRQLSPGFAQKAKLFGVPKIPGIFEHASEAKQRLEHKPKHLKHDEENYLIKSLTRIP